VIDIGGRQISQALVISVMVVVVDEGADPSFKVAGQEVVVQQHPVLHGLVPTLNLTLGLRVVWGAANMVHTLGFEILGQIVGNVVRRQGFSDFAGRFVTESLVRFLFKFMRR
jgi:hypothetical protein